VVAVVTGADLGPAGDELGLSPEDHKNYASDLAKAGIRLAGIALTITRGDTKAAAAILRGPLEAIGALPYEAAAGKYHYGQAG
jgi:hypothetical protein